MNLEEGRIIKDNPLRILGVFSDTPKKEIVANLGKLRAFAKTGRVLSFDSDFATLLGPINRTTELIEKANNDISLPKDKLQAGLFWFMQHTDNDKTALDYLKSGNPPKALKIIQKKGNYSGIINMAVLALILERWDLALYSYAYLLESDSRRNAFIKVFTDTEDYCSENELVDYISSKLIQEFPDAHWIEQLQLESIELGGNMHPFKSRFVDSKLFEQLTIKCVTQIKKAVDSVLNEASSVSRKDAKANLKMAENVEDKCKPMLKELRMALGKDNKAYIEYADNVANQVLDNCISYYNNDADNNKRARNVIKFTRYAYRTAESQRAKERAKQNLDILEEAIDKLIPESIEEEFNSIDELVLNYHANIKKYDYSEKLISIIEKVYSIILSIKNKLGRDNKHYKDISFHFVQFVLQEIKNAINSTSRYSSPTERNKYISTLHWGRQIMDLLAKFDMDDTCQLEYDKLFTKIIDGLAAIKQNESASENNSSYSTISSSSQYHSINTSLSSSKKNSNSNNGPKRTENNTPETSKPPAQEKKQDYTTEIVVCLIALAVTISVIAFWGLSSSKVVKKYDNETVTTSSSTDNLPISRSESKTKVENVETNNLQTSSISNDQIEEFYNIVQHKTGDRPFHSTFGKGSYDSHTQNSLLIRNGSSTDAVVFLERTNGKKVRHVFIERGDNFTMTNIPGGQYIIKVMQGTDWNPEKDNGSGNPKGGFMSYCSISKSESYDAFDFPYPSSGQYGQFEVTLYKVQNGNMQTETINENDLF